jgi:hypothetical protein
MKRLCALALLVAACNGQPLGGGGSDLGGGGPTGDLAPPPGSLVFQMTSFTVPAGGEVYKCQNFANPLGAQIEVQEFDSHMTKGSHHMLVFYEQNITNGALEDCSGLEFAATPYGSQLPDDSVVYPAGIAALINADQGLRLQSHYLNASTVDITASVELIVRPAAAGTVTQHAGVFFFVNSNLNIPPGNTPFTLSKSCRIPANLNTIRVTSHMHSRGTHFVATTGGQTIYETDQWNEPKPGVFDPPFQLTSGSTVDFACTWLNDTGMTLTFGESARTNEMCIFSGVVYPTVANVNLLPCI